MRLIQGTMTTPLRLRLFLHRSDAFMIPPAFRGVPGVVLQQPSCIFLEYFFSPPIPIIAVERRPCRDRPLCRLAFRHQCLAHVLEPASWEACFDPVFSLPVS